MASKVKLSEAATIQQFIEAARRHSDPIVLEHAIIFFEAMKAGVVYRGKNNETMRKLRRLGFFTLDKASTLLPNYNPAWPFTSAGRAHLASSGKTGE